MGEHPILFSAPMIRALLDGTKTQTRRIVKPPRMLGPKPGDFDVTSLPACPYGVPGDRLWARETWAGDDLCGFVYRADHPRTDLRRGDLDDGEQTIRRWRPSIFMPRAASRITLEVASVRVERLQSITDADIAAEGVTPAVVEALHGFRRATVGDMTQRWAWEHGWDAINGKRAPWSSNPWVWRVEFRRLTRP